MIMKNEHLIMSLCVVTKWGNWHDLNHLLNFHNVLLLILILIYIMQINNRFDEDKDLVVSYVSYERGAYLYP